MPSPTDFNLSPYYDDFSKSKNFHSNKSKKGFKDSSKFKKHSHRGKNRAS